MTDEHAGYKLVGQEFVGHGVTVHSKGEYVRHGIVHTNTVEGFFSLLKRGNIGTYHHVSEQHLHRYCSEFDFRYSTRKLDDFARADENLLGAVGKRLTYRRIGPVAAEEGEAASARRREAQAVDEIKGFPQRFRVSDSTPDPERGFLFPDCSEMTKARRYQRRAFRSG
jgi:hypothetical protein